MSLLHRPSSLRVLGLALVLIVSGASPVLAQDYRDPAEVELDEEDPDAPIFESDEGVDGRVYEEADEEEEAEGEGAAQSTYSEIEEITVTANRREESLQEAAVSVTALQGSFIEEVGLTNFTEIQKFTPNLQIVPGGDSRSTSIRIRGIGSVGSNAGIDPSVGIFIDGVYQGRAGMSVGDLVDIQSIEVLRGPQGTLYGKNTAAGAITVRTRRPDYERSAMVEFVGGNYHLLEGRGMINVPLVEDTLATRLTGYGVGRDGYETNYAPEFFGDDINDTLKWGLRSSTLWDVTDQLSLLLIADYSHRKEKCCNADVKVYGSSPSFLPPATDVAVDQGLSPLPVPDWTDRIQYNDIEPRNIVSVGGVSLEASLDTWDHVFTWLTAWRRYDSDSLFDGDFSHLDAIYNDTQVKLDQISTELKVVSPPLEYVDYLVGLYFYYSDMNTENVLGYTEAYLPSAFPFATGPQFNVGDNNHKTISAAGYADLNLHVSEWWGDTPDITITGGIRVGWEDKIHKGSQISNGYLTDTFCPPPYTFCLETPISGAPAFSDQSEDQSYVTGRGIIKYQPTPDIMLYASYASGFKSGGYKQLRTNGATDAQRLLWFAPENSSSYELGVRTSCLSRMITFNATGFYTDYDDFQAQIFDSFGISVENAGRFITAGFEADLTLVPIPEWMTVFGVGYTYTEYKDFDRGPCTGEEMRMVPIPDKCRTPGGEVGRDMAGERLDNTPRLDLTLFSNYENSLPPINVQGLPRDINYFANLSYNYQSTRWLNAALDPNLKVPPTNLLDLRIGLRSPELSWELQLWVQNVTDENYFVIGFDVPTLGGLAAFLGPPRTFGGTIRLRF